MTAAPARGKLPPDLQLPNSVIADILEAAPDGVLVVDAAGVIVAHNRRLLDLFGVAPEQLERGPDGSLVGTPDRPLLSLVLELIAERESFLARVNALYADPLLVDECEVGLKDGRTLERHSRALHGKDEGYLGRVWFFRDVTGRKRIEAALRELSCLDPLTGVANRREFFEVATRELSRAQRAGHPLSFVMLDLDLFKNVNDAYGHATGDRVLKAFTACVRDELRSADLLARLGGEEFAILAPDTDASGVVLLAERVRERVRELTVLDGLDTIGITVSLGAATVRPSDATPDDVLRRADAALYEAKRLGRDRTILAP